MRSETAAVPRHVAVIPDGNRRWARARGLPEEDGYATGVTRLLELCLEADRLGVREITAFCFSVENRGRPPEQTGAIRIGSLRLKELLAEHGFPTHVVGEADSPHFPSALAPLLAPPADGPRARVNLLVNYGAAWDLATAERALLARTASSLRDGLGSRHVSDVELVIRWGGRSRTSGLLPVQGAFANVVTRPELWPDFAPGQLHAALAEDREQARTHGV